MPILLLDRKEIRAEARELIRSGAVNPIKMTALYLAITLVLNVINSATSYMVESSGGFTVLSFSFVSILVGLVALVLGTGYTCYCLGIHRREHMPFESLFDAFSFAGKVILLSIVQGVFIFLWSLLFVIPGIIAAYRYSFAMLNLCENPALGVMEALELSKQQTYGYKGQLFMLNLSFFGWLLLAGAAVSGVMYLINGGMAGILQGSYPVSLSELLLSTLLDQLLVSLASLYLTPYIQLSICGFYLRATAKPEEPQLPHSDWSSEG